MVKFMIGETPDERAGLVECLSQQQEAFVAAAYGLTDEQARRTPTAGALSIAGLIKHATTTQRSWTSRVLAAPNPPAAAPSTTEHVDSFAPADDETLSVLLARLAEQSAATRQVIVEKDLETPVPVPTGAPWFPKDVTAWSVRWVALHLIEELARHAGHADIVRESIDGATMYELMAAVMGLPESGWLRPWRPAAG